MTNFGQPLTIKAFHEARGEIKSAQVRTLLDSLLDNSRSFAATPSTAQRLACLMRGTRKRLCALLPDPFSMLREPRFSWKSAQEIDLSLLPAGCMQAVVDMLKRRVPPDCYFTLIYGPNDSYKVAVLDETMAELVARFLVRRHLQAQLTTALERRLSLAFRNMPLNLLRFFWRLYRRSRLGVALGRPRLFNGV